MISALLALALTTTPAQDDGFVPMFNGRDLGGWTPTNTPAATWQVREDGVLHCTGQPIGELRTTRMYQNFVLELEWRHLRSAGNAGIFVWADDVPARGVPFHRSVEVQVLDHGYGNTRSHTTHGDIFPIHGATMTPVNGRGGSRAFPTEERSRPSPEWNHYRITCQDGAISLAVNGKVVTRGTDASPRKGYICLESEGSPVEFRNVRIQVLADTPVEQEQVAIQNRGYSTLYTGLDLAGWKAAPGWRSNGWRLVAGADAEPLETERHFADFGFLFDAQYGDDTGVPQVQLRGDAEGALRLDPDEYEALNPKGWNRFEGVVRANRVTLSVNGHQVLKDHLVAGLSASGPMRLVPDGPVQFANLFTRPAAQRARLTIPDVARDEVICFALYTVHERTLKLTAQLYPLGAAESRGVWLEVFEDGEWREAARTTVVEPGWTAPLRVEDWDDSRDVRYRVRHGNGASYEGLIRRNPRDQDEIVVCGFTGNSIHPSHGGDIPKHDLVENIRRLDADVLFFSGDQVYDHNKHLAAWLKFGRDFGDVIKDRPTITIPDDHDVGQANLWGHNGKQASTGAGPDGGYFKPVPYVQEVERAQTSHLPDPFDPTPIERGIGVYYTDLVWGGVSFAILEDRKFKTGPQGLIPKQGPRPDHILNPDYDPKSVDVPQARLLGERQLAFLDRWARDWTDAQMKVALSQTIFCGGAHIHGKVGGRLHADLDSNGWPQTGRNKAIAALRRAHAVHFAGDQHLATIFHHGVDDWNDAIWSFCVPSIANLYLRWWSPLEPGRNRAPGQPEILGEHVDGFGNKLTAWAVANPTPERQDGNALTTRAAGFGVMRLNKRARTITMECWPRGVDVSDPSAACYPGWPKTIHQLDNDGRRAVAWLPEVVVTGIEDPVIEVIEEATGELVYALRVSGTRFRPKVYAQGTYTLHVGEGDARQTFTGLAAGQDEEDVLAVEF